MSSVRTSQDALWPSAKLCCHPKVPKRRFTNARRQTIENKSATTEDGVKQLCTRSSSVQALKGKKNDRTGTSAASQFERSVKAIK